MVKLLLIFASFGAVIAALRAGWSIISIFNDYITEYNKTRTAKYAETLFIRFSKKD